jgi:putative addiction module killer protein/probable addiction module antidote protein
VYEIRHYLTEGDRDVFLDWRSRIRDTKVAIAVDRRVNRIELGNFGDHKFLRDGVWELRIDVGPGYRIYYAIAGSQIILLLSGGDKRTQSADIDRACEYWQDWQRRNGMKDRLHDEAMAELFQKDPAYALELLNSILEDGEHGELLIALRQMTKAFGGVQAVADKANLNPTQLYRTLSEQGNPELRSLTAILKAMGLRLAIERVTAA